MSKKLNLFILGMLTCIAGLYAQINYPKSYFRSPLDIPLLLAGNFGEIRSNHFHGGIDIKTESVEGKFIYAAAEGYVSRIVVSPWGYGKSLYLTHPNGYVTVYAHLQRFSEKIENYIKNEQYGKQSYSAEAFLFPGQIKVIQGEIVAISGNTGGSSGPHLHFEIRNAITGYPVNPLLFGFDIKDSIKPAIKAIRLYPLGINSHVNNYKTPKYIKITGANGNYNLRGEGPVKVYGEVGFGVEVYDYLDGAPNKCGIFSIELRKDGERVYYHLMETCGFQETKYINCHIDYPEYKKRGMQIQKSFVAPNNKLGIYKEVHNRGIIDFSDEKIHDIQYIIKDSYGNTSILSLRVQSVPCKIPEPSGIMVQNDTETDDNPEDSAESYLSPIEDSFITYLTASSSGGVKAREQAGINLLPVFPDQQSRSPNFVKKFLYQFENYYSTDDVKVIIPADILYEDLDFEYKTSDTIKGAIALTHFIHNPYVPLHTAYKLSIRTANMGQDLRSKALIVSVGEDGSAKYLGGSYEGDFITADIKYFGTFTVFIDTIPPKVRGLNILQDKDMGSAKTITVSAYDKLSGINTYNAYLDGHWILMEYEPKTSTFTYNFEDFDKYLAPLGTAPGSKNQHRLKVVVTDNRNNSSELSLDFVR